MDRCGQGVAKVGAGQVCCDLLRQADSGQRKAPSTCATPLSAWRRPVRASSLLAPAFTMQSAICFSSSLVGAWHGREQTAARSPLYWRLLCASN